MAGVSFTISDKGKIYRPQPKPKPEEDEKHDQDFHGGDAPSTQDQILNKKQYQTNLTIHDSSSSAKSSALFESTLERLKALGPSFCLNLFTNGFTFGNTNEFFHDVPENLNPYDLRAKSILTDIERGHLPKGILHDDVPCKYVNGTILCEVRDYRDAIESPIIKEVPLKMRFENVIEDDKSSMYHKLTVDDQLKFESSVRMSLYPHLNLDPTPTLDFCKETVRMIDLGIEWRRNTRKRDSESKEDFNVGSTEIIELDVFEVDDQSLKPVGSVAEDNWTASDSQEENVVDSHDPVK